MEMTRRNFLSTAAASGAFVAAGTVGTPMSALADEAGGFVGHTWDIKPEPITDIATVEDYEVVVVGAGIAGVNAFEAACEAGAKTVLIEQAEKVTGHGAYNGCMNCTLQKEAGLSFNPDEAIKLMMRFGQQIVNRELLEVWAYRSGEVMDHIIELVAPKGLEAAIAVGQTAKGDWDTNPEPWREFRTSLFFNATDALGDADENGNYPEYFLGCALVEIGQEFGGQVVFNTHAEQLVGDAKSGITGVVCRAEDGSFIQYNASKGVILATGDIAGNPEMVDVWAPIIKRAEYNFYFPKGGNHGDGILMGKWAGAALSMSPAAPMVHPYSLERWLTPLDMCWLAVNKYGKRYGCEVPYEPFITNGVMTQPQGRGYYIFDANYEKYVVQQHEDSYELILADVQSKIDFAIESGQMFRGNTLEELAEALGIDAAEFAKTVERYNGYYDAGVDLEYDTPARFLSRIDTPPFYAGQVPTNMLCCPFGLHVDRNSQVLTDQDEPIAGLFAIGNVQGDFYAFDYPVTTPGISHGRCLTFGQLVGRAVAQGTTING